MSSYSRIQLESFLKTLDIKAKTVLDVGGSQLPVKGRTKSWDVKDYKILDLEKPHDVKQISDVVFDLNVCQKENSVVQHYSKNKVDIIFCTEVMEYIYNPYGAVKNLYQMLKKNGKLYISFHFIYPHHNPIEEDCLRYTKGGVIKLLNKAGFKTLEIKPRYEMANNIMDYYRAEKMRPAKEFDGHNIVGHLVTATK